ARPLQTVDLGQVETDPCLVDARERAAEMAEGVGGAAGGEQYFGREPEIILRQRTSRRGIADLGVDQSYGIVAGRAGCGGPAGQNQAARAPWRQAELFGL